MTPSHNEQQARKIAGACEGIFTRPGDRGGLFNCLTACDHGAGYCPPCTLTRAITEKLDEKDREHAAAPDLEFPLPTTTHGVGRVVSKRDRAPLTFEQDDAESAEAALTTLRKSATAREAELDSHIINLGEDLHDARTLAWEGWRRHRALWEAVAGRALTSEYLKAQADTDEVRRAIRTEPR